MFKEVAAKMHFRTLPAESEAICGSRFNDVDFQI